MLQSSRATVPTGYGYVLPDQNGWSRYLHFEAAWALVLTGLVYVISGLWTRHFRKNLFPAPADRTWLAFRSVIAKHLRLAPPDLVGGQAGWQIHLEQAQDFGGVELMPMRWRRRFHGADGCTTGSGRFVLVEEVFSDSGSMARLA